jgi:hypothetical protein
VLGTLERKFFGKKFFYKKFFHKIMNPLLHLELLPCNNAPSLRAGS